MRSLHWEDSAKLHIRPTKSTTSAFCWSENRQVSKKRKISYRKIVLLMMKIIIAQGQPGGTKTEASGLSKNINTPFFISVNERLTAFCVLTGFV